MTLLRQSRELTETPTESETLGPEIVGPCLTASLLLKTNPTPYVHEKYECIRGFDLSKNNFLPQRPVHPQSKYPSRAGALNDFAGPLTTSGTRYKPSPDRINDPPPPPQTTFFFPTSVCGHVPFPPQNCENAINAASYFQHWNASMLLMAI
ncbi:hypothetical protein TNCV_2340041 [Trichonephila clavipes]|nr:hypothetical protein TNCV_2340041 [Trichonephila clavipes]